MLHIVYDARVKNDCASKQAERHNFVLMAKRYVKDHVKINYDEDEEVTISLW